MSCIFSRRLLNFKYFKFRKRYDTTSCSAVSNLNNIEDKKNNLDTSELKLKFDNDPNKFGTLTRTSKLHRTLESMMDEEGDIEVKNFYEETGKRRLRTKEYADIIKQFVKEKKLLDAIDVLEVKMLKEDNVKPESYIYSILIDACAKFGYSKKAFQLFNQMKKRDLKVFQGVYTSLFNACAISEVHGDGLECAKHLRNLIKEKGVLLNQTNYHAMIKAFGHCGDPMTAFSIVDEMVDNGIRPTAETYCFLLQACVSDRDTGFRHAMVVWRKMLDKGVKPTVFSYNLMLRCAKDCNFGDTSESAGILSQLMLSEQNLPNVKRLDFKRTNEFEGNEKSLVKHQRPMEIVFSTNMPNILKAQPNLSSIVSIGSLSKPEDRLMMMGGSKGFLDDMLSYSIIPNIKTMTQIIDVLPPCGRAELEILDFMKSHKVKMDIGFCNNLMKKRNYRGDYFGTVEVLRVIRKRQLKPDMVTFGCLSVACRTIGEVEMLLKDIESAGFRPNVEIAGGILNAAVHTWNPKLICMVLDLMLKDQIEPNNRILKTINRFVETVSADRVAKEEGNSYNTVIDDLTFISEYEKFGTKYKLWLKFVDVVDKDEVHPWTQFRRQKRSN